MGGGSRIGAHVVIAGQVGIAHHRAIGDHVKIGGQSGVTDDLSASAVVWGSPAQPMLQQKRQLAALRRLPRVLRRLAQLGILDETRIK